MTERLTTIVMAVLLVFAGFLPGLMFQEAFNPLRGPDIVVGRSSDAVGALLAIKPDSAQPVYHVVVSNGCYDVTRIGDRWPNKREECE